MIRALGPQANAQYYIYKDYSLFVRYPAAFILPSISTDSFTWLFCRWFIISHNVRREMACVSQHAVLPLLPEARPESVSVYWWALLQGEGGGNTNLPHWLCKSAGQVLMDSMEQSTRSHGLLPWCTLCCLRTSPKLIDHGFQNHYSPLLHTLLELSLETVKPGTDANVQHVCGEFMILLAAAVYGIVCHPVFLDVYSRVVLTSDLRYSPTQPSMSRFASGYSIFADFLQNPGLIWLG